MAVQQSMTTRTSTWKKWQRGDHKNGCCNKMQHDVPARCSRTCCCLFKHVVARHVAAFSIMLQLEMLPTFWACCSRTCCLLFAHVLAGHVAAFSSMLQPDMLPPVRTCCSLIHTCCSRDRIFSMHLLVQTSLCAAQAPIDQRLPGAAQASLLKTRPGAV